MRNFRSYVIGLLFLPIVAVGALFYIPGPDGEHLLTMGKLRQSIDSFNSHRPMIEKAKRSYYKIRNKITKWNKKDPQSESLKNTPKNSEPLGAPTEKIYKWCDKSGNWHFSNKKPPDGVEFEIVGRARQTSR